MAGRRQPDTPRPADKDEAAPAGQADGPASGLDPAPSREDRHGAVPAERPAARRRPLRPSSLPVMALSAALTLLPLGVLTYVAVTLSSNSIAQQAQAQVRSLAVLEAHATAVRMDDIRTLVGLSAEDDALITDLGNGNPHSRNLPALQTVLQQILTSDRAFVSVAVVDRHARLIAAAPPAPSLIGQDFSYRDWFKWVSRTGKAYVSSAFESARGGRPLVVSVAAPIRALPASAGSSPVIGYLATGLSLEAIEQYVDGFERGQAVSLTVTDQHGVILAAPGRRPGLVSAARDPRVRRALAGQTGVTSVDVNGRDVLSGYAPVGDLGWAVHADIAESVAFAAANHLRLTVGAIASGLALALLLGAFVLGRAWRERTTAEATIRMLNAGLESRVARRTADLVRANQNLGAFAYSVAHDLRSPLRALSGFSEALTEEYGDRLDETGRDYTARISAASERMGALIDDLLRLAGIARAEMHLVAVNLSAEAVGIAGSLRAGDPGRRACFAIQDDVWVRADRRLMRMVIESLLENAWKFSSHRPETRIEFGTKPTGDGSVCCYVRDNGIGFDPAYTAKLFQPFERLHSAEDFPGTGIGLACVRRIVERHGGRTWAEGVVDGGATFYFTIDAERADAPHAGSQ